MEQCPETPDAAMTGDQVHMTPSTEGAVGPGKIQTITMLAGLLESVERGFHRAEPDGYRRLASRLRAELIDVTPDERLRQVLAASPATAEIYENLNYGHAGLCLQPMDAAIRAEQAATELIARVRGAVRQDGPDRPEGPIQPEG